MRVGIIFLIFWVTVSLYSTIINVPDDQPTIQAGIDASVDADTVLVQPGIYYENINYNGKNITVASLFLTTTDTTYISSTIIDGNENGSVVTFENGEDSTAVLNGFHISFGSGTYSQHPSGNWNFFGGGIFCNLSSRPILQNLIISECDADYGGGLSCSANSNPHLKNIKIFENIASSYGGGINCIESSPNISNIFISNNSANHGGGFSCWNSNPNIENANITNNSTVGFLGGGGVYSMFSDLTMLNSTVSDNSAVHGGGISVGGDSNPILENMTISGNTASECGGGIFCFDHVELFSNNLIIDSNTSLNGGGIYCSVFSSLNSLVNTLISNNSAVEYGGGIYLHMSNSVLRNVTISNNTTCDSGGGIYCNESNPILQNVTISDNTASDNGGGIYCKFNSSPSLINCITWNNLPTEIYFSDITNPNSISISYSDIQDGEAGIVTNNNGTVNWLEGNIDEDPLFVGTGDHPFMLQDLSPCVNAGISDTTGLNLPEFDLAGNPRVFGGRIDMGAYENQNVVVETDEILIPKITKLYQNFPNPFNPSTTIKYSLKEDSKVKLNIYNIKGQKIKQLVNDQLAAGQHSVVWNGADNNNKSVSSGIYFYKLKTYNFEKTKKMILMK